MTSYARFFEVNRSAFLTGLGIYLGGTWMWLGFVLAVVFSLTGDSMLGNDDGEPRYRHEWILNIPLFLSLPLVYLALLGFAWMLGSPGSDLFGLGHLLQRWGYDLFASRQLTSGWDIVGGMLSLGYMLAGSGTNIGHELTHRTRSLPAMVTGRWLLATTCDASFAIEHVYGHHINVGTETDPATARRGENVYAFILRSTVGGYASAWRIERARLHKLGHGTWTWRNRMLRGNLMSLAIVALFAWAAGWLGALVFLGTAAWGKAQLEFTNYMEHYGLVRVPGEPVQPRHSWNSNKRFSSQVLLNLTRHSHHHHDASVPYFRLKSFHDAPMMVHGYLTTIYLAMIPPLWHRVMIPRLKHWDAHYATAGERRLAALANARSGLPGLDPAGAAA